MRLESGHAEQANQKIPLTTCEGFDNLCSKKKLDVTLNEDFESFKNEH